jgi:hypothetical protein
VEIYNKNKTEMCVAEEEMNLARATQRAEM